MPVELGSDTEPGLERVRIRYRWDCARSNACLYCMTGGEDAGPALWKMLRAPALSPPPHMPPSLKPFGSPCEVWVSRITFPCCKLSSPLHAETQETLVMLRSCWVLRHRVRPNPLHSTRKPTCKLDGSLPTVFPASPGEGRDILPPQLQPPGVTNYGVPRSDHGLAGPLLVARLVGQGLSICSCCTGWLC